MPTNRPFFANFFTIFRAHPAVTKTSSTATTSNITTTASTSFAAQTVVTSSTARAISTKATPSSQTQASPGATAAAMQHLRHGSNSSSSNNNNTPPQSHPPPPPHFSGAGVGAGRHTSGTALQTPASPPTRTSGWAAAGRPHRRGSDSSSDSGGGFREVLGAERWYVGGRTAAGEERFLALRMARREGSWERRSADQLSL